MLFFGTLMQKANNLHTYARMQLTGRQTLHIQKTQHQSHLSITISTKDAKINEWLEENRERTGGTKDGRREKEPKGGDRGKEGRKGNKGERIYRRKGGKEVRGGAARGCRSKLVQNVQAP